MSATAATAPDLVAQFPGARPRASLDHPAFDVPAADLVAALRWLRDAQGYDMLVDISGIDWDKDTPRFSAAYHLYSTTHHAYVRVVAHAADNLAPELPTVTSLWPAADWHERETWDFFGIKFAGHPDLRRILMWDEYPYHPLRKEFPLAGLDAPLPSGADVQAETGAHVKPAPMMGGPFVAPQCAGQMSEAEPRAKDQSWTERQEKPAS